ncbi:MAG: porin family protein [Methylacidiphilales bacterium]|nr:porin family protein [Candidatus Methylacidiphilales bacterium]
MRASLFTLALATGLLGLGEARAADFGIARPMMPPVIEEYGSGWYLRGDVGWTGYTGVSADYVIGGVPLDIFSGTKLEDSWVIGGGFGYSFGWFRTDVTADYRAQSEFAGTALGTLFTGEVTTWSTLLNGYFDLGTWSGVTPYIGGGIGAAEHQAKKWRDSAGVITYAKGDNWDFAWAFMAGVAVKVSPHASLDIGYRYIDLGQPETGFDSVTGTDRIRLDNVSAHEVRAGVRYMID